MLSLKQFQLLCCLIQLLKFFPQLIGCSQDPSFMELRVFKKITVYNFFTIDSILYCLFPQKLLKTTSTIQEACKQLGTKS